jgi:AhpD family alkylhydroperoxidase
MKSIKEFNDYRARMNEIILTDAPLVAKRFFSLDGQTYQDGALPASTRDLIGLACSMVMRCDDCVTYHLQKCVELGVKDEEIWEAMSVALIVGGSITIPELRKAVERLKELRGTNSQAEVDLAL